MSQLPDVNVLLALVWPRHEGHAAAHAWFAKSGHRGWATNTLTQLGVFRLLTNPTITRGAVSAQTALDKIGEATRHPGHEFWKLDQEPAAALREWAGALTGHGQWTDVMLLVHATERDGVLVTFDSGIKSLASGDGGRVLLLKHG